MLCVMTIRPQETWVPEWTFGDRLRKVRRDRRISQRAAAEALGVKESQIASWETAANNPRDIVAVAKRCQLAWGVPAEWMLGLDIRRTDPDDPDGGLHATNRYQAEVIEIGCANERMVIGASWAA